MVRFALHSAAAQLNHVVRRQGIRCGNLHIIAGESRSRRKGNQVKDLLIEWFMSINSLLLRRSLGRIGWLKDATGTLAIQNPTTASVRDQTMTECRN